MIILTQKKRECNVQFYEAAELKTQSISGSRPSAYLARIKIRAEG